MAPWTRVEIRPCACTALCRLQTSIRRASFRPVWFGVLTSALVPETALRRRVHFACISIWPRVARWNCGTWKMVCPALRGAARKAKSDCHVSDLYVSSLVGCFRISRGLVFGFGLDGARRGSSGSSDPDSAPIRQGIINNLGYYNLSSSKRDGYVVIFLWETKSYLHHAIKLFARSLEIKQYIIVILIAICSWTYMLLHVLRGALKAYSECTGGLWRPGIGFSALLASYRGRVGMPSAQDRLKMRISGRTKKFRVWTKLAVQHVVSTSGSARTECPAPP